MKRAQRTWQGFQKSSHLSLCPQEGSPPSLAHILPCKWESLPIFLAILAHWPPIRWKPAADTLWNWGCSPTQCFPPCQLIPALNLLRCQNCTYYSWFHWHFLQILEASGDSSSLVIKGQHWAVHNAMDEERVSCSLMSFIKGALKLLLWWPRGKQGFQFLQSARLN
jgi:hypothetical protein